MKNKKSRRKSVVRGLLLATGGAFVLQACAPIVAEFGAGKPLSLNSADVCLADAGKGDAR